MPSKKTRKQSKRHRRRTLRRKSKKGGSEGQTIAIPSSAFKVAAPVNSTDIMGGISKL
jgi:hypothetical protein